MSLSAVLAYALKREGFDRGIDERQFLIGTTSPPSQVSLSATLAKILKRAGYA